MVSETTVFCSCGQNYDNSEAQQTHSRKHVNKHNHVSLKHAPAKVDAKSILFSIWAWERLCSEDTATILIHATHHLHLNEVIEQTIEPLPQLIASEAYYHRLILNRVFEALASNITKMTQSDEDVADDLIVYYKPLEDEPIEKIIPAIREYRRRQDAN